MLTLRQQAFVDQYVVSRNAAEAARKAGYSPNGAKVAGCRLLTNVNLQAALRAKEAEMAVRLELDRNAVIGGIFDGIASARHLGDAGNVIRGWLAVARIAGLDKPEAVKKPFTSARGEALQAKFQAMSVDELLAISEGR